MSHLPNTHENSPQMLEVREKEQQALELRKAGASLDQIAKALGYYDHTGARKALKRAIDRIGAAELTDLRVLMTEQLNDLYRRTTEIYSRKHPVIHNGKLLKDPNTGELIDDDNVKLQALNTLVKVQESARKLLGVDAPKAVELTGPDGGAIPIEVTAASITQRLRALPAVEEDAG